MALRKADWHDNYVSLQRKAHSAVARAIAKGLLPAVKTQACVDCHAPALCYDHRDYRRPLEVQPVCERCNFKRGRAAPWPIPGDTRRGLVAKISADEVAGGNGRFGKFVRPPWDQVASA